MRKFWFLTAMCAVVIVFAGCSGRDADTEQAGAVSPDKAKGIEFVDVPKDEGKVYLNVSDAKASSFDQTPDWAPEPDPMAAVDGDILTRWSSDYEGDRQWIYFDFGKEKVVNEVIIRWERAYAVKYKIQISKDAETWKTVFYENASTGGVMTSDFPAVKCRYIRIFGEEKVEKQWGISIWEAELYGPANVNPYDEISKEAYLKKGETEEKKKEAEALINKLSSKVVPLAEKPFQQGVVYTSWMAEELSSPASDITLASLKQIGFDSVAIMIPMYQEDLESDLIYTNEKEGGDTPNEESIRHAISICHKLGLRVMIKPHIDPRTDEPRMNIIANEKWFDSYEKMILRYAVISEEENVEIFSVGTELESTTFERWAARWSDLIEKVRNVYKGAIIYSANWTEYIDVPFWDKIDIIGIDAYFPLTNEDEPTLENLRAAWEKHADDIEAWLAAKGYTEKGVILTEIGYTSTDGTNKQPWVAVSKTEDQQEQADCFEATFSVLSKRPWFKGYYLWQYMPQERWSPLGFTINKKKAKNTVAEWIKKFSNRKTEEKGV